LSKDFAIAKAMKKIHSGNKDILFSDVMEAVDWAVKTEDGKNYRKNISSIIEKRLKPVYTPDDCLANIIDFKQEKLIIPDDFNEQNPHIHVSN